MSSTHEDYRRKTAHRGPSDRNFGLVFTAFFLLVGLAPLRHRLPVRVWALALAGALLVVSILRPSLLRFANRVWIQIGLVLGKVVNPIVTGLLFYLVFTPAGLVLKWTGKDLLRLRPEPDAPTYWQARSESLSDMSNQF